MLRFVAVVCGGLNAVLFLFAVVCDLCCLFTLCSGVCWLLLACCLACYVLFVGCYEFVCVDGCYFVALVLVSGFVCGCHLVAVWLVTC